jgi:hypothetical protein
MASSQYDISIQLQNNTSASQVVNIMSSSIDLKSNLNNNIEFRWNVTGYTFTTENIITLQYKGNNEANYSLYQGYINQSIASVVQVLNNLGIGYFYTYSELGNDYIATYNNNYTFGQLIIANSGDPATINWTMTEYSAPLVFIDANFNVKRASDGFVYQTEFSTGSGTFTVPSNVPLYLNPFSDTTQGVTTFWNTYTQATLSGTIDDGVNIISTGSITLLKNNGTMAFDTTPTVTLLAGGVYNINVSSSNPS